MNWSKFLYVMFGNNYIQDGVHMPLFSVQNEPKIHYNEIFPNKEKIDKYFNKFKFIIYMDKEEISTQNIKKFHEN